MRKIKQKTNKEEKKKQNKLEAGSIVEKSEAVNSGI